MLQKAGFFRELRHEVPRSFVSHMERRAWRPSRLESSELAALEAELPNVG